MNLFKRHDGGWAALYLSQVFTFPYDDQRGQKTKQTTFLC